MAKTFSKIVLYTNYVEKYHYLELNFYENRILYRTWFRCFLMDTVFQKEITQNSIL